MFWTIVGAILFIEIGIPIIICILSSLSDDGYAGCIVFVLVILGLIAIFG